MRKLNSIVSMLLIVLFVVHAAAGGFQLMGVTAGGNDIINRLAWLMAALLLVHVVIGIKLTADSAAAGRKSGHFYLRANALFWTRRISGFAMIIFIALHLMIFVSSSGAIFRLKPFAGAELISQLLLAVTLIIHILANIKPLSLSFGVWGMRVYLKDILLILSVIMLFAAASLLIYYFRWNVIWRV